jgi:hypothetical protein
MLTHLKHNKNVYSMSWDLIAEAQIGTPLDYVEANNCEGELGRVCPDPCIWQEEDGLCKTMDYKNPWAGTCSCYKMCHTPAANIRDTWWPWKNESQ